MFLKPQILKNLMKKAWNGAGLTVANTGEQWYICGYSWIALIDKEVIDKKTLAAIIELTGELPGEGQGFTAAKEKPNQYELKEAAVVNLKKKIKAANTEMTPTIVMLDSGRKLCRLLQNTETGDIKLINDVFIQIISPSEVDVLEEGTPSGPVCNSNEPYLMFWMNERCIFAAYTLRDPEEYSAEEGILKTLATLGLPEKS